MADESHVKEASANFISSDEGFRESECQSYSHLKKDLQFLTKELKSMSEIINVLKEEMVYKGAAKQHQIPNTVHEINPKINAIQCDNCSQLDNQLKIAINELSSVKLITEILNEEIKTPKLTSKCTWRTDPDPFCSSVTSKNHVTEAIQETQTSAKIIGQLKILTGMLYWLTLRKLIIATMKLCLTS